ncbi:MAG: flavodoxin domain-containing protein, partial [Curtobacterium sp.]
MTLLPPTGSLIPVDAPFSAAQESWLAGFIAGIAAAGKKSQAPAPTTTVDVLFGTQTGNAEFLADQLVAGARARGLGGRTTALDDVSPEQLAGMSHVLVVTSTYGEGEMPDNAGLFWDAIQSDATPRLEGLQFAVLGLGDSGYDEFCQAGKLLDTRFEQLGATRIHDRVDCDVDFEDPAALWTAGVLDRIQAQTGADGAPGATAATWAGATSDATAAGGAGASRASRPGSQWNKRNP